MENGDASQQISWVEGIAHVAIGLLLAYPTIIGLLEITTALMRKNLLLAGIFLLAWFAAVSLYAYYTFQKWNGTGTQQTKDEGSRE